MHQLLTNLNKAADVWFSFVYHSVWQASLLAVLILAAVGLGRRWPSPLRYWLLVLALAKFALPPVLSLPTGLFSHAGPAVQTMPARPSPLPAAAPARSITMDSPNLPTDIATMPVSSNSIAELANSAPELQPPAPALQAEAWLMLLHAVGAIAVASWIVWSLIAMRRGLRRAREVHDGELWRRLVAVSNQIGLRHPPRLVLSPESCGPVAFGVLRPVVLLPEAVAALDPSALDAILAHEVAHHRRRDPLVNWVQLALTAAWWFNPLFWVLNRQIRKVREDCCDDLLLTQNLTTGQAYCNTLLSAASRLAERRTAAVALGFGGSLHPLGRRFERIMDQTLRRAPRLSLSGVLVLVLLASAVLPGLRRSGGDESDPSAKQVESEALSGKQAEGEVSPTKDAASAVAKKPQEAKASVDAKDAAPTTTVEWPEGATVTGNVVNHRGVPVANAEVLLLGKERVIVDADRRTWFVPEDRNA